MTEPESFFPRELLSQSNHDRVAFFQNKKFNHPHLKVAFEQLMRTLRYAEKDTLVLLSGPPRVGKTTLVERVEQDLLAGSKEEMSQNPGIIPVISIEAACQNTGGFDWKDHHRRLLQAALEPPNLIAKKRDPDGLTVKQDVSGRWVVRHGSTNSELRRQVEECFRHRQVRTLIIDEAHHLAINTSGRRQQTQMEVMKSFTSLTNTTQVLVGTYDLLVFQDLSAQLNSRITEIHLPRYHVMMPEDQEAFRTIVRTLQKLLPLAEEPDLVSVWEFLYERSAGCIGLLKKWLTKALVEVLETKRETLTIGILKKVAPSKNEIASIVREIVQGEHKINRAEMSDQAFRALVGVPDLGAENSVHPNGAAKPDEPALKHRRRRAGERNPTRDPVGIASHVG